MEPVRIQEVLDKFSDRGAPPALEGMEQWCDFLKSQVYEVAIKVATRIQREKDGPFWPTISEFNKLLREEQRKISGMEIQMAQQRNAGCDTCAGVTWTTGDPDGVVPCPSCRSATYKHWKEGRYDRYSTHSLPTGVDYPLAMPPQGNHDGGPVVAPERVLQWVSHLERNETCSFPEDEEIDL